MRRPTKVRTPCSLSHSVHHQLNAYALAASTAGVSLLALAQPGEAKIVYTSANVRISGHGQSAIYYLDLNHDRQIDFIIQNTSGSSANDGFSNDALFAVAGRSNGIAYGSKGALAMVKGSKIGSSRAFGHGPKQIESGRGLTGSTAFYGNWKNVTNHYLGLKFWIKGQIHYGWARLSVQTTGQLNECKFCHYAHLISATLTGYAYETIPDKPIIAGKTKGPDELEEPNVSLTAPPPQPATLAMLALGTPGPSIWRREEPAESKFQSK
jgi:hypothetical protein